MGRFTRTTSGVLHFASERRRDVPPARLEAGGGAHRLCGGRERLPEHVLPDDVPREIAGGARGGLPETVRDIRGGPVARDDIPPDGVRPQIEPPARRLEDVPRRGDLHRRLVEVDPDASAPLDREVKPDVLTTAAGHRNVRQTERPTTSRRSSPSTPRRAESHRTKPPGVLWYCPGVASSRARTARTPFTYRCRVRSPGAAARNTPDRPGAGSHGPMRRPPLRTGLAPGAASITTRYPFVPESCAPPSSHSSRGCDSS